MLRAALENMVALAWQRSARAGRIAQQTAVAGACVVCGKPVETSSLGPRRLYCRGPGESGWSACGQKAYRQRVKDRKQQAASDPATSQDPACGTVATSADVAPSPGSKAQRYGWTRAGGWPDDQAFARFLADA
jgi:hypothetical protein